MPRRAKADTDWMTTREAAEFINEVFGLPGNAFMNAWTESRVRRAIDGGKWTAAGVKCEVMPGGYYVSRTSLAEYLHEKLCAACERSEAKIGTQTGISGNMSVRRARRPTMSEPARPGVER
jgi:hypothetical protein